jgi:putative ABC transport system permease protein
MKWKKLFKAALRSISRHRMRSLLTMLGMIIGVGSVIAMVSLGSGTQATIEAEINAMGTNMLIISPGSSDMGGIQGGRGSLGSLSVDDVSALDDRAKLVKNVSPMVVANRQVIAGNNNWPTSVTGVDIDYPEIREWTVASGSFFTEKDIKTKKKVAVLGETVAGELFPGQDPVGARIRVGNVPFTVIGVMDTKGETTHGMDQDDVILAPWKTVMYRLSDGETVNIIMASAIGPDCIDEAKSQVEAILRENHRIGAGEEDDFIVNTQTEIIERAGTITGTLTLFLGSIAGVSLLVGGIGIMNIMLVSVTERTREIGIRLAIGARGGDVLAQFLIEALMLSTIGGMIGIVFGVGGGHLVGNALGIGTVVSPAIVGLAFAVSAGIGVFFGFYPARKASALDPILALRHE